MMLIEYRPDDYEVVSESRTCEYHKRNPGNISWPGCTCSGSHGLRRKDPLMDIVDRHFDEHEDVFKRLGDTSETS